MKTDFMKNDVLEIKVEGSEVWMEKIEKLDTVKEAALFGNSIHAVAPDAAKAIDAIKALISGAGVKEFSVLRIEPSLEDVFVSLIEDYDEAHK